MPDPQISQVSSDHSACPPIGPRSTAGEVALRLADLALGTFGSVKATEQDRIDLADHMVGAAVLWINQRWDIGLATAGEAPRPRKPESNGANQGDWHDANIGGC